MDCIRHRVFRASSLFLMREKLLFETTLYSYQEGHCTHKLARKGTSTEYAGECEIYPVPPTFLPSNINQIISRLMSVLHVILQTALVIVNSAPQLHEIRIEEHG